jgi:hypothetical protein
LAGVPIVIEWQVHLATEQGILVLAVTVHNDGDQPIRIDQDRGDTHDGMQLVSRFGLRPPENRSTEPPSREPMANQDWRYCLPHVGERYFDSQPLWKTHSNAGWAIVSSPEGGFTLVYLRGTTAPKMVVVNRGTLDYMVNEYRLSPDKAARYRVAIVPSTSGRPTPSDGRRIASHVRKWAARRLDGDG